MEAIRNKQARFDYEILEKFEAGLELFGYEVKSIKKGLISLEPPAAITASVTRCSCCQPHGRGREVAGADESSG